MPLSGRLLPERAIRPSHVAETETTRHRITSFRFVGLDHMMGSPGRHDKGAGENSPSHGSRRQAFWLWRLFLTGCSLCFDGGSVLI
jgi:hypothetical protein